MLAFPPEITNRKDDAAMGANKFNHIGGERESESESQKPGDCKTLRQVKQKSEEED